MRTITVEFSVPVREYQELQQVAELQERVTGNPVTAEELFSDVMQTGYILEYLNKIRAHKHWLEAKAARNP